MRLEIKMTSRRTFFKKIRNLGLTGALGLVGIRARAETIPAEGLMDEGRIL